MYINEDYTKSYLNVANTFSNYLDGKFIGTPRIDEVFKLFQRGFIIAGRGGGKTSSFHYLETLQTYNSKIILSVSCSSLIKTTISLEETFRRRIESSGYYFDQVIILFDDLVEFGNEIIVEELIGFLNQYSELSILIAVSDDFINRHQLLLQIKKMHYASLLKPVQTIETRRYWAGGFGKGEQFYPRLEDFKKNNYWQALDYDEDSNQVVAENAWALFREIKIGDWFLIKGYGGGGILKTHYAGEVLSKDENLGKLNLKKLNHSLYHGEVPKGSGAGNWFNTLLEIHRPHDIEKLFFTRIESNERSDPSKTLPQNEEQRQSISIIRTDFTISEGDEAVIGVNELAETMANLLKRLKETDKGKMVGIFGNWGRGKTFLVDKIWNLIEKDETKPFIRVDFHAWKYQDTPASWAYLYEAFTKSYFKPNASLDTINQEIENTIKLLQLNYKRIGFKPILTVIVLLIVSILGFNFSKESHETIGFFVSVSGLTLTSLQIFSVFKRSFSKEAKDVFKKYYSKKSYSSLLGVQAEIQNELKLLLKSWIPENANKEIDKRILLFVDDIDRCSEDRIMMIIDALRVMLEDEEISRRVIVLAAIDERVLKRAIKSKYHDLLSKDIGKDENTKILVAQNIVNEYMDKLFLSGISLGLLTEKDRREVLNKYIKGRVYKGKEKDSKNIQNSKPQSGDNKKEFNDYNESKTRSSNEKSQMIPSYNVMDSADYDLTEEEEIFLSDLMAFNENATPRQIRIFYYRYLLARNILLNRLGLFDVNESQRINMARILMHYTVSPDLAKIKVNKNAYTKSMEAFTEINILNEKYNIETKELLLIYEVLEIVIAY